MNSKDRYGAIAARCVGFVLLASTLWAQEAAAPRPAGIPQDWSDHNIVFTLDGLAQHPEIINQEPRVLHQLMKRFRTPFTSAFGSVDSGLDSAEPVPAEFEARTKEQDQHRDWSASLGKGHVAANMYPVKYSFNPATASCTDFVIFGLDTSGVTGGQANLVGITNLYAGAGGACTGPSQLFAYNVTTQTGGKIVTSPVLSLDGTKVAFVESGTTSIFHVVTIGTGGMYNDATLPATMTSLQFSTTTTTTASPWIDYAADIVYVADDNGILYQITPVFKGAGPPALSGAPWPVTVSSGTRLTPPVLDKSRKLLMMGAKNGDLYQIDTTNGAVAAFVVGAHGDNAAGVVAPPILDVTSGTTFAVSANDGTSAVLVEADTNTLAQLAKARIGEGGVAGATVTINQPAFDYAYYTTGPASGAIYTCGTGTSDTTPWQYSFGFTGRTMQTTAASSEQLIPTAGVTCTGWTEFFNPNVGANGTDFFFFGLTSNCPGSSDASGCVASITTTNSTLVTADIAGGPSGIVVDGYSTAGQASSIYLTAEGANTAYKFTQNGLN